MLAMEVKNLSRFYGSSRGIEDVSFELPQNEVLGVLGLNGAGKSTLLKLLANLLRPSEGSICIFGETIERNSLEARRCIGYLPDHPPLYEEMSVRDYLQFLYALRVKNKSGFSNRLEMILNPLSLHEVADKAIAELSHGFKQRVNLAQALIHNPSILILDEPMNGLDPVQIFEMRKLILELKKSHTILLSSHLLFEITKTCDRMLILHQGRLVAQGTESYLRDLSHKNFVYGCTLQGSIQVEFVRDLVKQVSSTAKVDVLDISSRIKMRISDVVDCGSQILKTLIRKDIDVYEFFVEENDFEKTFVEILEQEAPRA